MSYTNLYENNSCSLLKIIGFKHSYPISSHPNGQFHLQKPFINYLNPVGHTCNNYFL